MLDGISIPTLHAALDGLAERKTAISDDISNVNTPYFRARRVAFEDRLRSAVRDGEDPMSVTPSTFYTSDPVGLTENNVDLTAETLLGVDTQLRYELALRATGDRFSILRTAVKGV